MPVINLFLNGDECWPDLEMKRDQGQLLPLMGPDALPIGMALLKGGMLSGKPSVTFRIDLPDGRTLLTETSLELLTAAVRAMRIRAGQEVEPS